MGIVIAAVFFASLWFSWHRFLTRRRGAGLIGLECVVASCVLSVACVSLMGLGLTFVGLFRPVFLATGLAVTVLVLLAFGPGWRSRTAAPAPSARSRFRWPSRVEAAWGVLLVAGAAFYAHPGEHLLGAWDPGVYVATSAHIAREGSWEISDEAASLLVPGEREKIYGDQWGRPVKYPGFYVGDTPSPTLQPQFFPLYSVLGAFLFWGGGLQAALYSSGVLAWLSLVMLLLCAREMAGARASVIAGLLWLANPVQLWFSGFQTAELAMQFFFLAGLWMWAVWLRTDSRFMAVCAGALLAGAAFSSVTGLFLLALLAVAHLCVVFVRRTGGCFFLSWLFLAPWLAYQLAGVTPQYFGSVVVEVNTIRDRLFRLPVALSFSAVVLFALLAYRRVRGRGGFPVGRLGRGLALGGAVAGLAYVAFCLYSGDITGSRWLAPATLFSKSILLCALAGLLWIGWRRPVFFPVLVVAPFVFLFVFAERPMMTEVYPWAYKRWLPVALPVAALGFGFFGRRLAETLRIRGAGIVVLACAGSLALRPLYRGRDMAFVRDWPGLHAHLDRVVDLVPPGSLVLAGRELGTPLELVYGRNVLPVYIDRETKEPSGALRGAVARLIERGIPVCAVRLESETWDLPFGMERVGTASLRSQVLEQSNAPFHNPLRNRSLRVVVERLFAKREPADPRERLENNPVPND